MFQMSHIHLAFDRILFEDASITIPEGLTTIITGDNGCGKSTLLDLLAGLRKLPDVQLEGFPHDLTDPSWRAQAVGMVAQEPRFPSLKTIRDQFELAAALAHRSIQRTEMLAYLETMRLDLCLEDEVDHLSGGEKQRLALALALVKRPRLLLLDEPTSALEKEDSILFMEVLERVRQHTALTIVMVTHQAWLLEYADWIYRIEDREIQLVFQSGKERKLISPRKAKKVKSWYRILNGRHQRQLSDAWYWFLVAGVSLLWILASHWITASQPRSAYVPDPLGVILINAPSASRDEAIYPAFSQTTLATLAEIELVQRIDPYTSWQVDDQLVKVVYPSQALEHQIMPNEKASYSGLNLPIIKTDGRTDHLLITSEDVGRVSDGSDIPTIYVSYALVEPALSEPDTKISALHLEVAYASELAQLETTLERLNPEWTVLSTRAMQAADASRSQEMARLFTWFTFLLIGMSLVIGVLFCLHENTLAKLDWAILMRMGMSKRQLLLFESTKCAKEGLFAIICLWFEPVLWIQAVTLMGGRILCLLLALWRLDPLVVLRGKQKSSL